MSFLDEATGGDRNGHPVHDAMKATDQRDISCVQADAASISPKYDAPTWTSDKSARNRVRPRGRGLNQREKSFVQAYEGKITVK